MWPAGGGVRVATRSWVGWRGFHAGRHCTSRHIKAAALPGAPVRQRGHIWPRSTPGLRFKHCNVLSRCWHRGSYRCSAAAARRRLLPARRRGRRTAEWPPRPCHRCCRPLSHASLWAARLGLARHRAGRLRVPKLAREALGPGLALPDVGAGTEGPCKSALAARGRPESDCQAAVSSGGATCFLQHPQAGAVFVASRHSPSTSASHQQRSAAARGPRF